MNSTEKLHWWLVSLNIYAFNAFSYAEIHVDSKYNHFSQEMINAVKIKVSESLSVPLNDVNINSISYLGEMTHTEWVGD